MPQLKVSQIRSGIGGTQNQRHTLRTLGLRRVGDVSVKEDRPEVRGMLATVQHLVSVEGLNTEGPSGQGPSVQGPSVQGPSVQGPSVQGPTVQDSSVQGPSTEKEN